MKRLSGITMAILCVVVSVTALCTDGYAAANEIKRDGRFIAYDDDTVLDTKTHLMWAAHDNGSAASWPEAKNYCDHYRGGGYTDWRMPTSDELAGLYDASVDRKFHLTRLIKLSFGGIWSSDQDGNYYRIFTYIHGIYKPGEKPIFRALPVRSAK